MSPLVASSPMTESSALTALRPERSVLVVIDVQTAFRPAIDGFDRVAERCARMVRGARALEIPIVVTEQYPEGLGATVPEIADVLPLSTRSVYVVGKSLGSTGLTIYGPGKRLIAAANVVVSADIDGLKARLHDILPGERDIAVRAANQSIVLSGTVGSPVAVSRTPRTSQFSYSLFGAQRNRPAGHWTSSMR